MPQRKLSDIKNPKEFQSRIMKYGVENANQLSGLILFNSIKSRDNFLLVYSKYNIPFKIYEDGLTIKSTSDGVIRVLDCMAAESCVFKKFYN
jgi:hypothetical protein